VLDYSFITAHLSRKFKIPYVLTEHSPAILPGRIPCFNSYETDQERVAFARNAAARLAVSRLSAEKFEKCFGCSFEVVYNFADSIFDNKRLPSFPKNTDKFIFVNIGHMIERKAQLLLLEGFAEAFKSEENVELHIMGTGQMKEKIEDKLADLKLDGQVKLAGNLDRDDMIDFLDRAHVLVISSYSESFGMVAAEAFKRGLPVVSTVCGGPEEYINPNVGLIADTTSSKELASKLLEVYRNYGRYDPLGIIQYAKENFSEEGIVPRITAIYERIIRNEKI
jgi:glycosyltransferase involved in cell wall biosynthesis